MLGAMKPGAPLLAAMLGLLLTGCGGATHSTAMITNAGTRNTAPVYLPSECSNEVVRPTGFLTACGDGGAGLEDIKWQSWGGPVAYGSATALANDCEPDCAAGGIHHAAAEIYARSLSLCNGRSQYTRVAIIVASEPIAHKVDGTYTVACAKSGEGVSRTEPEYEEKVTVPGSPSDAEIREALREAEAKKE